MGIPETDPQKVHCPKHKAGLIPALIEADYSEQIYWSEEKSELLFCTTNISHNVPNTGPTKMAAQIAVSPDDVAICHARPKAKLSA